MALRDAQAKVGCTCNDPGLGRLGPTLENCPEIYVSIRVFHAMRQQRPAHCSEPLVEVQRRRPLQHLKAGLDDRQVAGAAAQVARNRIEHLLAVEHRRPGPVTSLLVDRKKRHHESRGAKAALARLAGEHGADHRVRRRKIACAENRLAVDPGQRLDAGVDRHPAQLPVVAEASRSHCAGPTVALRARFLHRNIAAFDAQKIEQGGVRCRWLHTVHLAPMPEPQVPRSRIHQTPGALRVVRVTHGFARHRGFSGGWV